MAKAVENNSKDIFKWNDAMRVILFDTRFEAQRKEGFMDSGFESAEWSKIEEKFNSIFEITVNKQQLQNQFAELKRFYTMYGYIINQVSGFGIDPGTKLPTASDKCWEISSKLAGSVSGKRSTSC